MTMNQKTKRDCASTHFGPWMVREEWMAQALAAVQSGQWEPQSAVQEMNPDGEDAVRYEVRDGVALIGIAGHITKNPSSFGGTSTIRTRQALRMAAQDTGVRSIMLVIDSPGGSVYGVSDVADDVRRINADKPVFAYCDSGLCCSAAYWIASQARRVFANPSSLVGNIGVYGVLVDTSEADKMAGLRYVLVSTGGVKGLGADGKVTEELVADYQREINEFASLFFDAVRSGRGFSDTELAAVSDGRAFVGEQALPLGLVDEIVTFDVAMQAVVTETDKMNRDEFLKSAAEHPEWVAETEAAKTLAEKARTEGVEAGKAQGNDESTKALDDLAAEYEDKMKAAESKGFDDGIENERGRCVALAKAFASSPADILAAIESGHDVAKAKADAYDRMQAEAAKTKKIDAATRNDSGDGAEFVNVAAPEKSVDPESIEDPKERAAAEWDTEPERRKGFSTKDRYVAYRAAELTGRVRMSA